MAKKHPRHCAYCGQLTHQWTEDHAVSECLWDGRPLPDKSVKVPACLPCNNYWSVSEGYFRSILAMISKTDRHPILREMFPTVLRHFEADAKFRKSITGTLRLEPQFNDFGLFTGYSPVANMDWTQWFIVAGKIARGLYFKDKRRPLPRSHAVQVWAGEGFWQDVAARAIIDQMPEGFAGFGSKNGFDDVFMGKRAPISDDPDGMVYLFVFYKAVSLFAYTVPVEMQTYIDPSHPDQVAIAIAKRQQRKLRRIK